MPKHVHVTDGTRCWCKDRVPVMFNGEKVGTAEIDETGMINMSISSPAMANHFTAGTTEHLSIRTKNKE